MTEKQKKIKKLVLSEKIAKLTQVIGLRVKEIQKFEGRKGLRGSWGKMAKMSLIATRKKIYKIQAALAELERG